MIETSPVYCQPSLLNARYKLNLAVLAVGVYVTPYFRCDFLVSVFWQS